MDYNETLIDIQYALINAILIDLPAEILDVSYSLGEAQVLVQFVILDSYEIPQEIVDKLRNSLPLYKVDVDKIRLTVADFNKDIGLWKPTSYDWLDFLLLSKSQSI
ncbi:MAG: hypothetical protein AAF998_24545 [Bacteroidota bacterium]